MLDGLAHVDRDLLNLARVMGAKRTRTFLAIQLPATLSPLFSGLKIGATYAVTGAVIGEWVASAAARTRHVPPDRDASLDTRGVMGATILLTADRQSRCFCSSSPSRSSRRRGDALDRAPQARFTVRCS